MLGSHFPPVAYAAPKPMAGASVPVEMAAELVDTVGRTDFSSRLMGLVNQILPIGSLSSYILSRQAEPVLVATATIEQPDRTGEIWETYSKSLHRQDRTFDHAWQAPSALVTHCTRSSFIPEHRHRIYDRARMHERLSLTMRLDDDRLLALNLYRNNGQPSFAMPDAGLAARMGSVLMACVSRQAAWSMSANRPAAPLPVRDRLHARCPRLTSRELDVLEHLARGCTYDGVAAATGLSRTTVKTYRERAFAKLGLHFRSQLAALLLEPGQPRDGVRG